MTTSMPALRPRLRAARAALAAVPAGLAALAAFAAAAQADDTALPARLADTGLYAPGSATRLAADVLAVAPQYPLWSDGAAKRRWLRLPAGGFIDGSQPDAWQFPPGTKLWKEFAHAGRPVETRYIERLADGRWRFAAYVWNAEAGEGTLAPARGALLSGVPGAPDGRYEVPARDDCRACHDSAAVPVLGVSALQLAPLLRTLAERGLLRHLPAALLETPPRIAAATPNEAAALGYLHANCGHCHNDSGNGVPLRLRLAQSAAAPVASAARTRRSTVDAASRSRLSGSPGLDRLVVAGQPQASLLALRMRSRQPSWQMPPLGTRVPDAEGLALVDSWIHHDLLEPKEPLP